VILKGADHFQSGAVADVGEGRVAMPTEISLQDSAIASAIKDGAPRFQFAHALGCFFGVELAMRHCSRRPRAHRVGEMNLPVVAFVDVGQRGGDSAFGHHGVGFAQDDLQTRPTETPAAEASMAAQSAHRRRHQHVI